MNQIKYRLAPCTSTTSTKERDLISVLSLSLRHTVLDASVLVVPVSTAFPLEALKGSVRSRSLDTPGNLCLEVSLLSLSLLNTYYKLALLCSAQAVCLPNAAVSIGAIRRREFIGSVKSRQQKK